MEYFVVEKNKKYLTGHSYALGKRKYSWSNNIKDAIKFDPLHSDADHFANQTNGKVKDFKS